MAERKQRPRRAWLGTAAASLLVSGFVLPQPSVAAGLGDPSPPGPVVRESATADVNGLSVGKETSVGEEPGEGPDTANGAYLDYGPRGVKRMAELEKWLGGAELKVGHTYLPGDLWTNIEGTPGFLEDWAAWRKADPERMFVLNVPMLERNEDGVPDFLVRRWLRDGAAGDYDHHFRALAQRLVDLGVPDTVVVLGWEMNGTTYTHRCAPDPEAWKTYWKRIVTAMRAVPGQKFKFDFTPSRGRDAIPWTECYPGDDVVDILGMDSYDQPPDRSFEEQISEPYGLQHHVDFAAAHDKPISFPEWGLFRQGDNPEYMRGMLKWIEEHKPLYQTISDYCPHGVWQCDENPESSKVFRAMLSKEPEPTKPPVEPTKPPVQPNRPPNCVPLELGSWVEYWMGGKLCLRFDWWDKWR
ncbi:glycoside hydrolase family 26 protein [Streptomyces sp. NPDC050504]|uniref:glycoside hydrolase family 26 protein n=1 Tax=Streptomyces sp. NPDC050504 TaxID=3365618 RepID=UPI0037BBBC9F